MIKHLAHVTVMVKDQQAALAWYTEKLGFEKREDEQFGDYRWLTVAPPGQRDVSIVLNPPRSAEEEARLGCGTMWVLYTDDCKRDYAALAARGIVFDKP